MKLQLQGQLLRLRIDESELERLLAGETILNITKLGQAGDFSQALRLHAQDTPVLETDSDCWSLRLPQAAVHEHVARLPCRDALAFDMVLGAGVVLSLRFEVDVRDSLQVRGARRHRGGD